MEEKVVVTYHPIIARMYGKPAAIILNQIRYWLSKKPHRFDNREWVYNTYGAWSRQTGLSESSVKRALTVLRRANLIVVGNYNRLSLDRTRWYSVDEEAFDKAVNLMPSLPIGSKWPDASGQNDLMHKVKMTRPIPVTPTGNTSEINEQASEKMRKGKSAEEVLSNLQKEKSAPLTIQDSCTTAQAKMFWRRRYTQVFAVGGVLPPFTMKEQGEFKHLVTRCEGKAGIVLRRIFEDWDNCRHHVELISGKKLPLYPDVGIVLSHLTYILNWSLKEPEKVQLVAQKATVTPKEKPQKEKPIWLKE